MPRKSEQEWAIIKNEYITQPITYDYLSKKYNLSIRAICVRAIKDKWDTARTSIFQNASKIIEVRQAENKAKNDFNVINELEKLRKCKIKAELAAFEKIFEVFEKTSSINPLQLMQLVNKSKDSITETSKIIELLKGNATDRTNFIGDATDAGARKSRMDLLGINN